MKKSIKLLPILAITLLSLVGCNKPILKSHEDIVILYTNDVHCGYNDNMGYAGLAHYKKALQNEYNYVTLVDSGDYVQGSPLGTITNGKHLVSLMNDAGYDLSILGNHEFDYGCEQLQDSLSIANFDILCCNMHYTGKKDTSVLDYVSPYKVMNYGDTKIGFIGVTDPLSISDSTPKRFMEDGVLVYSFDGETSGDELAKSVQNTVDLVRNKEKVDYVILLTHLGITDETDRTYQFSSQYLASHTRNIDAILDGHSHTVKECLYINNIDNKQVPISQTGSKFQNIGQLTISNGSFDFKLIDSYQYKDPFVDYQIQTADKLLDSALGVKVTDIDFDLSIEDEEGVRMVRNRETNLGDLVADAYCFSTGGDIGLINGGGVRATINKGEVKYKDIINVNPFGNLLCTVELTGQDLLDMFEYFVMDISHEYKKDGQPIGEFGSWQQVSGLRFTVDTSIPTSVIIKDGTVDVFDRVGGARRITSMEVLENNTYSKIEPTKTYRVTSTDYLIKNGGCGMSDFLKNKKIVQDDVVSDYQSLLDYFANVKDLSIYRNTQNRINVI
ncbi:MAG: bifunctional metallophosphatase/5'-nucleotidase [Bacilli bacterium]|nr:bifunctional metallophosphatase/5'-nucleotidase [Bacilli bacterium]